MSDNIDNLLEKLDILDLNPDEAKIYLELLHEPSTHLRLSHVTSINRTKVYRLIENLEKKSLVSRRIDDRGTFLVSSDPAALEIAIINQETRLKEQRIALSQLVPQLQTLAKNDAKAFVVRTYEGIEGIKQMLWHELDAKGELLGFIGNQTLEDLINDHSWAEKHRNRSVEAGYTIREIINSDLDLNSFTSNKEFMKRYQYRFLPNEQFYFNETMDIYNNTVAVGHWRKNQKVGVEIISKSYANMMRQFFETLWQMAQITKN